MTNNIKRTTEDEFFFKYIKSFNEFYVEQKSEEYSFDFKNEKQLSDLSAKSANDKQVNVNLSKIFLIFKGLKESEKKKKVMTNCLKKIRKMKILHLIGLGKSL
jgi:hypothetical protein